jgi:hypothetical protein
MSNVLFNKRAPKPTKSDMLAARPMRSADASAADAGSGKWNLTVPVQPTRSASMLFRLPAGGLKKTFELDELGKFVWDQCDGKTTVRQIIRKLARHYNLNEREAEVATVAFLRTLTQKGLTAMAMKDEV